METRAVRAAKNEALFREVNERIAEISAGFGVDADAPLEFLCECGDEGCAERIPLTGPEYERVRSDATWFVIVPGHERLEVETVVGREAGYFIVEKIVGEDDIALESGSRD